MRARTGVRHQLIAAIDTYASDMVELFLAEARGHTPEAQRPGLSRLRRRRRSVYAVVQLDARDWPANTNASSFIDGLPQLARSALPSPPEPAFFLTVALLGLLTNASLPQDSPRGSIRGRGALRSVP